MIDPTLALQKALVLELAGVAGGRIYDQPPANPTFPYVTFGACQVLADDADCIDGAEVFQQLDVWSRASGAAEAKVAVNEIVAAIDNVLFAVEGTNPVVFQIQEVRHLPRDPDGLTSHCVITFHGLFTKA